MPWPFCLSPASTPQVGDGDHGAAEVVVEELRREGLGCGLRTGHHLHRVTRPGPEVGQGAVFLPYRDGRSLRGGGRQREWGGGKRGSSESHSTDGTDKKWAGPAHQTGGK